MLSRNLGDTGVEFPDFGYAPPYLGMQFMQEFIEYLRIVG